ncbi:MAG: acetylornithine deacetylase [Holophagales bacterium]|nr:acetylornithine deacetylase [Holophagales bacterium]
MHSVDSEGLDPESTHRRNDGELFDAGRARLSDPDLLGRLVAFDSVSRNSNLPVAEFLADYLDLPGVRIHPNASEDGQKTNLVVEVGPGCDPEGRRGLVLSGHMDVVPADEPEWRSDPFTLVDEGDRFVGRGTCDMKGFVALAANVAARVRPEALSSPLVLILTYDEEVGTLGARRLVETWPRDQPLPRPAIIGEPTSLEVVRLHKGHARTRLVIRGTPAHSGYPHLGHDTVEPLGRAILALADLRRELRSEGGPNAEYFPEVPFAPLNLAVVKAGTAINVVPDRAELQLGFRVLPGMDTEAVLGRIRERLVPVLDGEDWQLDPLQLSPPMLLDADHPLHLAVCEVADQEGTVSASYATDAGWLCSAGHDCLLYGPGNIGVAHKPNEWVPKSELGRCTGDLETLVQRFCGP